MCTIKNVPNSYKHISSLEAYCDTIAMECASCRYKFLTLYGGYLISVAKSSDEYLYIHCYNKRWKLKYPSLLAERIEFLLRY